MIRKLRRKFIAINMLLVSAVLLAVFAVQTWSAYQSARQEVYTAQVQALEWITHTSSPGFTFDRPRPGGPDEPEPIGEREGRGQKRGQAFPSIPAFSVELDGGGTVIALQAGPGVEVTEDTAQEMADLALEQPGGHGELPGQSLSWLYRTEGGREYLAFADNSSVGEAVRGELLFSLLICAVALLAFFGISRFLSRWALRPVERAWEQQRQFVADASHELKTPVTVILANTGILLSHPDDTVGEQRKWIDYIQDEAGRMKSLVDDLLFLAKSDAARLPRRAGQVRLSELVTGSILPFESVAFERGVDLADRVAPGLTACGDEGQLRRLVGILLDNAIKYAGEGGTVTVTLDEVQGRARLTVHNTGPAIPAEHLPHLFERFYRADAARDREQGGYGLGLAIAKSIVDGHGGRISVASGEGTGTTFTVLFAKK